VRRFLLLFFAAPLLLAACASRPPVVAAPASADEPAAGHAAHDTAAPAPAADAHAGHHAPAEQHLPATAGPGYTVADVQFMQHMIGHHAQALVMAAMAPTHGTSEHFQRLAQKIDISQKDEIAFMKQWLTERNQPVPSDGSMDHMMMPGMLSPEQMAQLDAARGREFERLFLTFMIRHHEGALLMVEQLFDAPGAGQDPDIFRFATDVDADQRDEIYTMSIMLDSLQNPTGSPTR
jgi:uncharacterized protein (DUF305 family)